MTVDSHNLTAFFSDYAAVSFSDSAERHAAFYAPNFIAAAPAGSAVFANDGTFIDWLRKVREFNNSVGMQSLEAYIDEKDQMAEMRELGLI